MAFKSGFIINLTKINSPKQCTSTLDRLFSYHISKALEICCGIVLQFVERCAHQNYMLKLRKCFPEKMPDPFVSSFEAILSERPKTPQNRRL